MPLSKNHAVGIVTTASLPWFTGTSVQPLFRAIFLKKQGWNTKLHLPWLPVEQQRFCFDNHEFDNQDQQQDYIWNWLPAELRPWMPEIVFYKARYFKFWNSIFPLESFSKCITQSQVLLEEPEHLFWLQPWSKLKRSKKLVIGIVHTNYKPYVKKHPAFNRKLFYRYNLFLMRQCCHLLIPTSSVQQDVCSLSHAIVENINGVNPLFFQRMQPQRLEGYYFTGKLIAQKNLEELFKGLQTVGLKQIDLFGRGDQNWVKKIANQYCITPIFKGVTEQPWRDLKSYKIFINCSKSEHLCTTTAEALAMQKWVIIPQHPSNEFFYQFQNCLVYTDLEQFKVHLLYALTHEPNNDPAINQLTWDSAIQRLLKLSSNLVQERGNNK